MKQHLVIFINDNISFLPSLETDHFHPLSPYACWKSIIVVENLRIEKLGNLERGNKKKEKERKEKKGAREGF